MKIIPKDKDENLGWKVDYEFLESIQIETEQEQPSLEQIESIILELVQRGYVELEK